jgi:hypothetical protein
LAVVLVVAVLEHITVQLVMEQLLLAVAEEELVLALGLFTRAVMAVLA